MNKDQVKWTLKDIAAKVHEKAGKLAGSKEQQVKGLGKQMTGKVEKKLGDAKVTVPSISSPDAILSATLFLVFSVMMSIMLADTFRTQPLDGFEDTPPETCYWRFFRSINLPAPKPVLPEYRQPRLSRQSKMLY